MFIVLSSDIYLYETKYPGILMACVTHIGVRISENISYYIILLTIR